MRTFQPMKSCLFLLVGLGLLSCVDRARGADDATKTEVEKTLRRYFALFRDRDADGLREVVTSTRVAIEAGASDALAHVVERNKVDELFPPKGNDDLEKTRIAEVRVLVPAHQQSVAIARFTLEMPIDERNLEQIKEVLDDEVFQTLNEEQQASIRRAIKHKAHVHEMCAMFVREKGVWKIASIAVPR